MAAVTRASNRSRAVGVAVCLAAAAGAALAWRFAVTGRYESTTEAQLRSLHRTLLVVAVPAVTLVEGAIVYVVVRSADGDDAASVGASRRLELAWTVAIGLVCLWVGVLSLQTMAHPAVAGGARDPDTAAGGTSVTVTARQYGWTFEYEETGVRTSERLVLPATRPVTLRLTSRDVIHSLSVPGLGLKRDALPGQVTTVRTTPTETGTFRLYCAEFCGPGHAEMTATVVVVSPESYDEWLHGNGRVARPPAVPDGGR